MNKYKVESSVLSVGRLISKTDLYQKLAAIKYFKKNSINLTFEQLDLLYVLYQKDNISQSELGKLAFKDKANIARILGILEGKGFIERKLDIYKNRMVKKVFITEIGKNKIDEIVPALRKDFAQLMNGITEEQVENLTKVLEIYRNNIIELFGLDVKS